MRPPSFWQFYARGVMWAGVVMLPFLFLYDYLNSLPYVFPVLTNALDALFALGMLVIRAGCTVSTTCLVVEMTSAQISFYAYIISAMLYGFVIGIYLAQVWHPKHRRREDYSDY